ncbi:hypothetical protein VY88_27135 [Azospirillum thiophilum]|nr:hypothetical protein VY88_27135 [Azospirillum thiophilum]
MIFKRFSAVDAAYFDNMADYDAKKTAGIPCPSCGGTEVAKAIMAPRVGKSKPAPAPACPASGGCGGGGGCPMMM